MNKKAFTLVELIVVITILAVLATVAFISFQGYAANSRDSVRLADLQSMQKVNTIFKETKGKYPLPNDATNIVFSGATAWTQGVFGKNSYSDTISMGSVPTDPLTFLPYPYSVTASSQEYQIAAVLENPVSSTISQLTYAGEQLAEVYVKGDYNGQFLKVHTGSLDYLLGVPSILASDINSVDVMDIIDNQRLVYKGYNNLPASYSDSVYNNNGGFAFNPNQVVLFSGDIDDFANDPTARLDFLDSLEVNYLGTEIVSEKEIAKILEIKSGSPSAADNYVANILNNTLKTKIDIIEGKGEYVSGGGGDIYYNLFTVMQSRKSDGNPIGIYQDHLQNIKLFNNKLYFVADNKIWVSDGTDSGTNILKNITVGYGHTHLIEYNNQLYFGADDGINGFELWKSDGTTNGTIMALNLNPGSGSSFNPYGDPQIQIINNKLYYSADNGTDGYEIIEFNPTNDTAINKNVGDTDNSGNPLALTTVGNNLFFIAANDSYEKEVYVLNTISGIVSLVKDLPGGSYHAADKIYKYNDKVLFTHRAGFSNYQTRISDGTDAGTVKIYEGSKVANFGFLGNNIFFRGTNSSHTNELFISDGTLVGTELFMDIDTGSSSSPNFHYSKIFNGKLLFTASDTVNGMELWETDGTILGTKIVGDIYPGTGNSSPSIAQVISNNVYLYANNGVIGTELWKLDNSNNLSNIEDYTIGAGDTNFSYSFVKNNVFYFTDYNGSYNSSNYTMEYDNLYYINSSGNIEKFDVFLIGTTS